MNILLPIRDYKSAQAQISAAFPFLLMGVHKVVLLRVVEPPVVQTPRYNYDELVNSWKRAEESEAHRVLDEAENIIRRRCPSSSVIKKVVRGEKMAQLLACASDESIDLIVMSRGDHRAYNFFRRSFCTKIARKAQCRTIIVEDHRPVYSYARTGSAASI